MIRETQSMNKRILFVDDDIQIINAVQRNLRKRYELDIALGPKKGLDAVKERAFAVVVSDLKMPEMNGIQFLSNVKQVAPDAVRILLTGQADFEDAIRAVNEGHVFQFLRKPCPEEILINALDAALAQHRLLSAEREILRDTLTRVVGALVTLLGTAEPRIFSRAVQIRKMVCDIASELNLSRVWELEAAGWLSQIGCLSIHPEIIAKHYRGEPLSEMEQSEFSRHPHHAQSLLHRIPRLSVVAAMIRNQMSPFEPISGLGPEAIKTVIGGNILYVATEFERLREQGLSAERAIEQMRCSHFAYNPHVIAALSRIVASGTRRIGIA